MMKEKSVNINYVLKRDIDLLLIEEMYSNDEFVRLFTEEIDIYDFDLFNISHSVMDNVYGESDIVLYIKSNNRTIGLLIENKIDAKAMEDQYFRYEFRASDLVKKKELDAYYIFIVAPNQYFQTNQEAKKYPYSISYEKMVSYFNQFNDSRSQNKSHLITLGIEKRLKGYTPVEDSIVTQFWKEYYQYKNDNFPYLKLNEIDGPRGSRAVWPWFDTDCSKIKIAHKSDRVL